MIFSVDSSAWLDGWDRYYPSEIFPSLWEQLHVHVMNGSILTSQEVYFELEKKDDGLHDWLKDRKSSIVETDEDVQLGVIELLSAYPRLVDTLKGRSGADPFVISVAMVKHAVVVTGERGGTAEKPKIPSVCKARGLECIDFLGTLRGLGLRF